MLRIVCDGSTQKSLYLSDVVDQNLWFHRSRCCSHCDKSINDLNACVKNKRPAESINTYRLKGIISLGVECL